jgi:predicted kinase
MAQLNILVGLPGSGKSYLANELQENGAIVHSSDSIRKELYGDEGVQDDPEKVFGILHERVKNDLIDGKDVVYDATNISCKVRMNIINQFRKYADKIVAHYMDTGISLCKYRNLKRDRQVPEKVINNMYKTLQIPTQEEGFDNIVIHGGFRNIDQDDLFEETEAIIRNGASYRQVMGFMSVNFICIKEIYDLPQDSKYHTLSVSRHTYYVWEYIKNNYNGRDKLVMLWAAILHDTGKFFCKNFKKLEDGTTSRYANFIGHENVSAQIALHTLARLGYDDNFILNVVFIIQNHMKLLSLQDSPKGQDKLKKFVGDDVFKKLEFFRIADTSAK